jgi:hypothetical protein
MGHTNSTSRAQSALVQTVQSNISGTGSSDAAEGLSALEGNAGITSSDLSASTTVNSMEELKTLYPKLYNIIVQSMGENMMIDFRRREDHLEAEMKKNRENNS